MTEERHCDIAALLESHDPGELRRGLEMVRATVPGSDAAGTIRLCEMVLPLFYIDTLDHPEHLPVVEEAILVTSEMGEAVIPTLIQNLEAGDVKAQMAIAQALGGMGAKAIEPLLTEYAETCPDPACHAFLLYALGKVKSPEIARGGAAGARSRALARPGAARHRDARHRQVRGIHPGGRAVRGRARRVRVGAASEPGGRQPRRAVEGRAQPGQAGQVRPPDGGRTRPGCIAHCKRFLGEDEHFEWDRAYVVRKEAKEALGISSRRRTIEEDLL